MNLPHVIDLATFDPNHDGQLYYSDGEYWVDWIHGIHGFDDEEYTIPGINNNIVKKSWSTICHNIELLRQENTTGEDCFQFHVSPIMDTVHNIWFEFELPKRSDYVDNVAEIIFRRISHTCSNSSVVANNQEFTPDTLKLWLAFAGITPINIVTETDTTIKIVIPIPFYFSRYKDALSVFVGFSCPCWGLKDDFLQHVLTVQVNTDILVDNTSLSSSSLLKQIRVRAFVDAGLLNSNCRTAIIRNDFTFPIETGKVFTLPFCDLYPSIIELPLHKVGHVKAVFFVVRNRKTEN